MVELILKIKPFQLQPQQMTLYLAVFDFQPDFVDELEFTEGEILVVQKSIDDNWFLVSSHSHDQGHKQNCETLGIFPKVFVEEISNDSLAAQAEKSSIKSQSFVESGLAPDVNHYC